MSDPPPQSPPGPISQPPEGPRPRARPVRRPLPSLPPLPWWFPGVVLGATVGLVVGINTAGDVIRDPAPRAAYRATARVLVRPADGGAAVTEAERQRVAFLFRDRGLVSRALPAPSATDPVSGAGGPDPVRDIESRLAVEVTEGGVVTVALVGNDPDFVQHTLDQLVARFVEEFAALGRKAHDEQTNRLEQTATALRLEIDAQEKVLDVMARAHGAGDAGAALRDRLARAEADLAKGAPEAALLERRAEALKRRRAAGGAPDPVEAAQLVDADPRVAPLVAQRADAAVALEKERAIAPGAATVKDLQARLDRAESALAAARAPVRKEMDARLREADAHRAGRELEEVEVRLAVAKSGQEALRREGDAARQALASAHATAAGAEGLRRALVPLQEQAGKVTAQLARLRADGPAAEARTRVAGPALVEPARGPWRWGAAWGAALRAFAVVFGLVAAFQLTGLVFRALQPPR